ncbi:monocarboxylate transporter 9-like [Panulirus ornatus]|uniref:monocarboxylate transporter 9-like n=1 Tax=Panulirus ornatus TaxID=150431 RepID=UPI003A8555DF
MGGKPSKKLVPNRPPSNQPAMGPVPTRMVPKTRRKMVSPDGGWGWMIVLGACLSLFVFPAVTVAFGVLFTDRLLEMGATATGFSLICNGLSTVWSFFALLLVPLCELFGYRAVTMTGGLLAFLTLLLSAFTTSIVSFALTYSVLGGMSNALSGFCGVVLIPRYFDRRKGLANGIVASSAALGKIVMPPLVRLLMEEYGFVWACLLVGALSLHTCVAAMLYQPPEWHMIPEKVESDGVGLQLEITDKGALDATMTENGLAAARRHSGHVGATTPPPLPTTPEVEEDENIIFVMPTSSTAVQPQRTDDEVVLFSREPETTPKKPVERRNSKQLLTRADSLMSLANTCAMAPVKQKVYTEDTEPGDSCWGDCIFVKVYRMLDWSLLKQPHFHLVAWPSALTVVSTVNVLYALPGYVSSLGYTPYQSAFAISIFGAIEVVFRLGIALLSDYSWFPTEQAYISGFVLSTICTGVLTLMPSYEWVLLWVALDGVALSLTSVLAIHIIVDYLGVDQYAQVISFFFVFNGMGFLVIGSITGTIRDHTGSYQATYLWLTAVVAIAASVWLSRRCYKVLRKKYDQVPVQ